MGKAVEQRSILAKTNDHPAVILGLYRDIIFSVCFSNKFKENIDNHIEFLSKAKREMERKRGKCHRKKNWRKIEKKINSIGRNQPLQIQLICYHLFFSCPQFVRSLLKSLLRMLSDLQMYQEAFEVEFLQVNSTRNSAYLLTFCSVALQKL